MENAMKGFAENEGLIYKFSGSNLIKGDPDTLHYF